MRSIVNRAVAKIAEYGVFDWMSDEPYLRMIYWARTGEKLNLKNPKGFNEKLQWLKLYDRKPEYSLMVDKYEAKKYVAERIGEEFIIPTLGVWDRFDDIDFDSLPDQFVLKCTHDSGGLVICKDKKCLDIDAAKKKIEKSLKRNYYKHSREWPYKNVKPRVIAEKYLTDGSEKDLMDYKVFNFEGNPEIIQIDYNRFVDHMRSMFSPEWEKLPYGLIYRNDPSVEAGMHRPENLEAMLSLARKLSDSFHFLRTDFYLIDNRIYFGELTFSPEGGFGQFNPNEWDEKLGKLIILPGGGYGVINDGWRICLLANPETQITDFKFYCFDGEPIFCQVIKDRERNETIDFFDMEWNLQPFTGLHSPHKPYPHCSRKINRPVSFQQMQDKAKSLSKGLRFLRVDYYEVCGKLYFGEMTFFPASGFGIFEPVEWNIILGELIQIP